MIGEDLWSKTNHSDPFSRFRSQQILEHMFGALSSAQRLISLRKNAILTAQSYAIELGNAGYIELLGIFAN